MATEINGYGLRSMAVFNDCGSRKAWCPSSMQVEFDINNTAISCGDRRRSITELKAVNVTAELQTFPLEAVSIMLGLPMEQFSLIPQGVSGHSISLPPGHRFPEFHIVGQQLGDNGSTDFHTRVLGCKVTSFSVNKQQDNFVTMSMQATGEGTATSLGEFVIHDEVTPIVYTPSTEASQLLAWYDAGNCNNYADQANVSQLLDLSGNQRNLLQAAASSQPAYEANSVNGLGSILFDGVDDYLLSTEFAEPEGTGADPFFTAPLTIFWVGSVPASSQAFGGDTATSIQLASNATNWVVDAGTTLVSSLHDADLHVHAVVNRGTGVTDHYLDGVLQQSGAAGVGEVRYLNLGSDFNQTAYFAIRFCEMLAYPKELSVQDIIETSLALASKWGL